MSSGKYDVVVVGGGPGGYVAAIRAAQLGGKVALVEAADLGGTCTNWGCIPTKALLRSVECLVEARRAREFGVILGSIDFSLEVIVKRKDDVVSKLRDGIKYLLDSYGVSLIRGRGRLKNPNTVVVSGADGSKTEVEGKSIILATGSKTRLIPIPGLSDVDVMTNEHDALSPKKIPESLLIIGGGPEGVEFATIYSNLGSKVVLVEMMSTLLPLEDEEMGVRLERALSAYGVSVYTKSVVKSVRAKDGAVEAVISSDGGETRVSVERVLLAAGHVPNVEGLGLDEVGVAYTKKGITVNERMETSVKGIYAVGDVVTVSLAHVASEQGVVAAENAMGLNSTYDGRVVPRCIYTMPEVAAVGLTTQQAREQKINFVSGRFPLTASGRALTLGETEGVVKVLAEKESKRIIGVHIFGPRASDLIPEAALAMKMGATLSDVAKTIHPHPTLSEAFKEAVLDALGEAIHLARRVRQRS
ncbi:MAG: dihydrolipoyl dehydrogenase [Nitrososphaerales archaeon]